jgi:hypothetical protein
MDSQPSPSERAAMDFNLNKTISQLSIALVKTKIDKLKTDCDEAVEKDLGSRIRTLLGEVDTFRAKFNGSKQKLLEELQNTLTSLGSNPEAVNHTVSDIDLICPQWLSVIPESSILANRPPTPAMLPLQRQQNSVNNSSALSLIPYPRTNEGGSTVQCDQPANIEHPGEDDESGGSTRKKSKTYHDHGVGYFFIDSSTMSSGS